tara:strand:+ start:495 stop:872 length:378 start_codon:yes stop_codon:yes gene_type:complete
VDPEGLLGVQMAVRSVQGTQPLTVRDFSVVGMGLTGERPLPVALGERVYLLIDWIGAPMVRGALLRARVRRRRPDKDGWFVGVEVDDLRQTPWIHMAEWIDRANARQIGESTPVPRRSWPRATWV